MHASDILWRGSRAGGSRNPTKQAARRMALRLPDTINTHREDQGVTIPAAIGAAVGMPAAGAVGLPAAGCRRVAWAGRRSVGCRPPAGEREGPVSGAAPITARRRRTPSRGTTLARVSFACGTHAPHCPFHASKAHFSKEHGAAPLLTRALAASRVLGGAALLAVTGSAPGARGISRTVPPGTLHSA